MKLTDLMNVTQKYVNTNSSELKKARKGGNAKGVALDFVKFCKKNGQECHAYEGTFKLDKKQENGKKEVKHYWNILGTGVIDGDLDGTGPGTEDNPPTSPRKYNTIIDFAGKYDFVDTGLAEDLERTRYVVEREIS